ncbi:MAG: VapE family protein, partial [Clostridia bacterium]|nr:VapE family protein [Clostridia bacterium]
IKDEWFSDDISRLGDENVYRRLQGHWLLEMPEMLGTVNAKTVEEIKAFLSRQKDNYKVPYERHPEDRPRQCVFVGTSNTLDFLPLDRTGNRRFAPIMIHAERVEKHILADEKESRDYIKQLWAEMMVLYRSTKYHKLKLSSATEEYLKNMQKEFMPEDTKVGIIQEWLDNCGEEYVCSLMIYREALKHEYEEPKQYEIREINDIMNHSVEGWVKAPQHRFKEYGRQTGWRRAIDNSGFITVADDMKLPFD